MSTETKMTATSLSLKGQLDDLIESIDIIFWNGQSLKKFEVFRKRLDQVEAYMKEHNNG